MSNIRMKVKQKIFWFMCCLFLVTKMCRINVSDLDAHLVSFTAGDEEGDARRRTTTLATTVGSVGICCMAKDARPYMDEFIDYHVYVDGFDAIYVYDNSDDYELRQQLKARPYVETIHFPGEGKQMLAYQDCARRFRKHHDWLAFMDIDEFIVMDGHIVDYLNTFDESVGEVSLNWLIFGTGNETVYRDDPVTSRFRYSEKKLNQHVKSLVRTAALQTWRIHNVHFQRLKFGYHQVSADGRTMQPQGAFHVPPILESVESPLPVIHHYYFKSDEEYRAKRLRRATKKNKSLINPLSAMSSIAYPGDTHNTVAFELLQEFVPRYRSNTAV